MASLHLNPHAPPLKEFLQKVNLQWERRDSSTKSLACALFGPMLAPIPQIFREDVASHSPHPALFIDGGVRHLEHFLAPPLKHSLGPYLSLGDGDSSPSLLHLRFPANKDVSDLGLGLKILDFLSLSPTELHLAGMLGGDRGHEWCGILEVAKWLERRTDSVAHFEEEVTLCSPGKFHFHRPGPFSLMSLREGTSHLEGKVEYSLSPQNPLAPLSSHGLSNRATGEWTWASDRVALFFWRTP